MAAPNYGGPSPIIQRASLARNTFGVTSLYSRVINMGHVSCSSAIFV